ncbi:uncharacterized protein PHACADRAFT_197322 [Phanerochaete carnosa HHB-10118-sp]|uniref:Uncharacterized protein n=1 Tax=Phanerochaete carnosa (strain HHB-10118-sp) TaxID=650164 RepID=K5W6X3_PHACS|nr:uncharacterized protein PHACADRAFT_197322 [Phanerochaete carnosa HHB-10118-sp]EKM54890.1 hypothetical protein PHACADRAFT_197322 [Phanerochaete carnosa HHB-10118-sp]
MSTCKQNKTAEPDNSTVSGDDKVEEVLQPVNLVTAQAKEDEHKKAHFEKKYKVSEHTDTEVLKLQQAL